ncbi:uncharacterized protein LOC119416604 [Nematolebias whitei]|uniref:uncharacterized protein LOC119416604 n=1 Tax=Nematolebias whitei TaxID=451745 RepID=UPI00189951DB|nr:uncharacterized protein LOC119416604 [Nematolebias whitei]
MKVNKLTQVKGRSHKWKDVRSRRCRAPIKSSDLNSSPALVQVVQEHQVSVKKRPSAKRLKHKAKAVVEPKAIASESESKKSYSHTNGGSTFTMNTPCSPGEDLQDWKEYSQSIRRNDVETLGEMQDVLGGRVEGEALNHCAQRDDRQNHAVLVLQKDQTLCFRGKCILTCLYGRVEVMGFTIEEGQKSYPLFSPASHCPLTIRAMETSHYDRDDRTDASRVLQEHLPPASRKKLLKKITSTSSIVLLEPMETSLTRFLSSFTNLSGLFSPTGSELMSAVLDTPLNGLGMIPLTSTVEGLKKSRSCEDALNTVVNACKGGQ